jgi:hypothetical protein
MKVSIYGDYLLNEADDDGSDIINGGDNAASDTGADTADTGTDDTSSGDDSDSDEGGGDDDFNIDTSLDTDDDSSGGDESGGDEGGGDDSGSSDLDSGSSSGEGEVNPANTDIFASLSAEEQKIKILELKKQYGIMYAYIDDILSKMNNLEVEEDTMEVISRVSSQLYNLKEYLKDYMINIFPMNDFIQNDTFFNRFSAIIYSMDKIVEQLAVGREKKLGIEEENK